MELYSLQSTFPICFSWSSPQPCEVRASGVIALMWELGKFRPRKLKDVARFSQLLDDSVQTRYSLAVLAFFFFWSNILFIVKRVGGVLAVRTHPFSQQHPLWKGSPQTNRRPDPALKAVHGKVHMLNSCLLQSWRDLGTEVGVVAELVK